MSADSHQDELLERTADIVAAYVSNHKVAPEDLPGLIEKVHRTLGGLGSRPMPVLREGLQPVVPVKKSVTPDYLICLEDGKKMKMLKRHLMTAYSMTPDEYRAKWGLPPDYPMTAPNYARKRSSLAREMGLGKTPR